MEMSSSENKTTVVAQQALFKSLGDETMSEESEINCRPRSTRLTVVLLGLDEKSN